MATLRTVGELERITRAVGHEAAYATEADGLSPETIGKSLGISADAARSLLLRHQLHH
ncbi:hypothetical protein [Streptomyces sp. NPDC006134]|uniref:hypothetical protein n=1 Tax=Streptomyces sp. NPDC006134 TaxID=3154467 RepID=UPI003402F35D